MKSKRLFGEALIRNPKLRPSSEAWEEVCLIRELAHHVGGILVFLQDVLMPRRLEVHFDDGFERCGKLCGGG